MNYNDPPQEPSASKPIIPEEEQGDSNIPGQEMSSLLIPEVNMTLVERYIRHKLINLLYFTLLQF